MLKGRTVLVTGGASGIGAAICKGLAAEGANTVIADVQDSKGTEVAAAVGAQGHYVHCDVTDEQQVAAAVASAVSRFGSLYGLVTSAGVLGPGGCLEDLDIEAYRSHQAINATGTLLAIKHAARAMKRNPGPQRGAIVAISSVGGIIGGLAPLSYTVSKFAVHGIVQQAATELVHLGIRCNAVGPAGVATPLTNTFVTGDPNQDTSELLAQSAPNPELPLTLEHIADTASFLLSPSSGGMNGRILVMDQGLHTVGTLGGKAPSQVRDPNLPFSPTA